MIVNRSHVGSPLSITFENIILSYSVDCIAHKIRITKVYIDYESLNISRKILECRRFGLSLHQKLYIVGKI